MTVTGIAEDVRTRTGLRCRTQQSGPARETGPGQEGSGIPEQTSRASRRTGPLPDADDEFLVRRAQTGDIEAFSMLLVRHKRQIQRICSRMAPSHADAERWLLEEASSTTVRLRGLDLANGRTVTETDRIYAGEPGTGAVLPGDGMDLRLTGGGDTLLLWSQRHGRILAFGTGRSS